MTYESFDSWHGVWKTRNGHYAKIVDVEAGVLRGSWYSPDGASRGFGVWNSDGDSKSFVITSPEQIPLTIHELDLSQRKRDHDRWDLPEAMKARRASE